MKKMPFIHSVNGNGPKTAKIINSIDKLQFLIFINIKKLQFIHNVNGDISKTAKIIKR